MVKILNSEEQYGCLKLLIYGASGVGKTVFASTAPSCLFLDAEAGMLSVRDKKVDRIKIETFSEIREAFNYLKMATHNYKTVVVDSLTELQKKSMDGILEKSKYDKPTISDWGANIEELRKMVRAFRDLPLNVIFIALEQVEKDETGGTFVKSPGLQGRTLPAEVMGFVDVVGYMVAEERSKQNNDGKPSQEKEIVRAIRVQPSQTISAKDRSNKLGVWVRPDFSEIYDTIFPKAEKEKGGK